MKVTSYANTLITILLSSWLLTVDAQDLSFAPPVDISNGGLQGLTALDVGDFDRNGLLDVAVMEGGAHAEGRVTFAWFAQTSDQNWIRHEFGNAEIFDDFIGSARCGDMDRDGDIDLVLTNDGHTTGPLNVYLFDNPGKDRVTGHWPYYIMATLDAVHANDMRLADIDDDGKTDVIIRHKEPDAVKVLFQDSKASWVVKEVEKGQIGEGLAVGDINQDGLPDITMTGHWLKTPKHPRTGQYKKFDIEAGYKLVNKATKEEVGDINGDGRPDVVLSPAERFPKYGGDNYDLAWYECPEKPVKVQQWTKHVIKGDYNNAHCVKLADFDNDGDLDVLSAIGWEDREIRIYINDHGVFEKTLLIHSGNGIYSGAIADMDDDGDMDIVGEDRYSTTAAPWYYENLLE